MTSGKLVASPLPDQLHRDLASGLDPEKAALHSNIFIEAGAGTGKTETIVRRIINQLYDDPTLGMEGVVAITFTEKAAAELRNRFRKTLAKDLLDEKRANKDLANKLISQLDLAFIGTIHAFCRNILTEHAVAAEVPVGFRIANENSSENLRTDRARRVINKALKTLSANELDSFYRIEFGSKEMLDMVTLMDQKFTRMVGGYQFDMQSNTEDYQIAGVKFIEECFSLLADELEKRKQQGAIEFDDLLILTLRLLKADPKVRAIIHNTYRMVVVDEFQDTDPVQWEIVKRITSDPAAEDNLPLPGRLVVVGDPKQAIYAFRGGDINTYIQAKKEFLSFGRILQLTSNFRTVNPVLEFINSTFADYQTPKFNPLHMGVTYESLSNIHDPEHDKPGSHVTVIKNPAESFEPGFKSLGYDWTGYEFRQTALAIRKAIDEKWQVTGLGQAFGYQRVYEREANFADVCVLVPVRTHLKELLKEFESVGIPYQSTDPSIVYNRPLISGLRDAISVIAKSDDMTKLWGALKSPLFGFSDSELFEHRQNGGKWYIQSMPKDGVDSVNSTLKLLAELSENEASSSPVWVINQLVDELDLYSTLYRDEYGRFESSCLRMTIAHAQQWLSEGNVGLLDYLSWIDTMLSESTRAQLPQSDDLDSNSVKIMTIHASKGLEFPITVVTALASTLKADSPKLLFAPAGPDQSQCIEFCLTKESDNKYFESSGYSQYLRGGYLEATLQEINRLIYVASTRAQDHLIISAVAAPRSKEELGGGRPSSTPPRGRRLAIALEQSIPLHYQNLKDYSPIDAGFEQARIEFHVSDQDLELLQKTRELSAEKVMRAPSAKESDPKPESARSRFHKNKDSVDGRPLGRAVHQIMELIMLGESLPSPEQVQRYIADQVLKEQAEEELEDISGRIFSLLENKEILEALESKERWPELHLSLQVDEGSVRFVEGFADLVYKADDGYVLVDYKTDSDLEKAIDHYREQLGAYADMLQQITGQKPARVLIIHAKTEEAKTHPIQLA